MVLPARVPTPLHTTPALTMRTKGSLLAADHSKGGGGVERGGDPCGQYHLDKKNLAKGDAFEMRPIQMPVALAAKARQGTLDHPRIEAQASRRQPTGTQITQQPFQQGATLWQSHHSQIAHRFLAAFAG